MGAPNPLDKQTEILSNNLPYLLAQSDLATNALNTRAPSK